MALPAEVASGSGDAGGGDDDIVGEKQKQLAGRLTRPGDWKVEPPTDESKSSDDAMVDQAPGPLVAERGTGRSLTRKEPIPKNDFCDVCRAP